MNQNSQTRHSICASVLLTFFMTMSIADDKKEPIMNLSAKEIAPKIEADQKIVVLDIRTKAEYEEGHLAGAMLIDFMGDGFEAGIEKLDRNTTYVVHCRSGGRSGRALKLFVDKKFKSILHMSDGYLGWIDAGLETEK